MNKKLPKCKCCGERFVPFFNNSLQKFCMKKDECIKAHSDLAKEKEEKKRKKDLDKKIDGWKPNAYSKEYKKEFQKAINMLARNIDTHFGHKCVDCGKDYKDKMDMHGSHFNNVQGNENIRFNLHNIHKSKSDCNKFFGGRKRDYKDGLVERYGKEYAEFVDKGLSLKYPELHLSNREVYEKLAIVRKLNREFHTFQLFDGVAARDMFNTLIGIYTK